MTKKEKLKINIWRKSWVSTGRSHKLLSISSSLEGTSIFYEACKKAYFSSVVRALKSINKEKLKLARAESQLYLSQELKKIYSNPSNFSNDEQFDTRIEDIANKIRKIFRDQGETDYTYGNAQKFINMSIKYLLSSEAIDPDCFLFNHCYIPIDRRIMKKFKEAYHIEPLSISWSKCDCWEQIKEYENSVRKYSETVKITPIILEIQNW